MERRSDWMAHSPNELSLTRRMLAAPWLPQLGAQFNSHVVHSHICSLHRDTAVARNRGYTHSERDGRDTDSPGGIGPDDSDLASRMKPGNVCLCLTGRQNDPEDQQSDLLLEQLTDLEAKPALVHEVERILRSLMSPGPSSHEIVDISEEGLDGQTPERQLGHYQTPLTSFLLSNFLSDQGQDHIERWIAYSDSCPLFTLDSDSGTRTWKGKAEARLTPDGMDATASSEMSAGQENIWSDDNRSQLAGITSARSVWV